MKRRRVRLFVLTEDGPALRLPTIDGGSKLVFFTGEPDRSDAGERRQGFFASPVRVWLRRKAKAGSHFRGVYTAASRQYGEPTYGTVADTLERFRTRRRGDRP